MTRPAVPATASSTPPYAMIRSQVVGSTDAHRPEA
jgi:hypothetical protein